MKRFVLTGLFAALGIHLLFAQSDTTKHPIVIEPLKDSECLTKVLELEAALYKTSLNALNTPENLFYAINPTEVEERFPYVMSDSEDFDRVKYERLVPVLIEAIEELNELYLLEQKERILLQEDYQNYKITMENTLNQLMYQLEMLKSEMNGINEGLGVQQAPAK